MNSWSEPAAAMAWMTAQLWAAAGPVIRPASPHRTAMTRWPPAARRRATTNPSRRCSRSRTAPRSAAARRAAARPHHRLGEAGQLGERDLGHGGAGALHQGVLAQARLLGRLIDLGHLGRADEHGAGGTRPSTRPGAPAPGSVIRA